MTDLEMIRRASLEVEEREVQEVLDSFPDERDRPNYLASGTFARLLHSRAIARRPESAFPDYPDHIPAQPRTP